MFAAATSQRTKVTIAILWKGSEFTGQYPEGMVEWRTIDTKQRTPTCVETMTRLPTC